MKPNNAGIQPSEMTQAIERALRRASRLLKYPLRKRKAMLGEFDFSDFLFAS